MRCGNVLVRRPCAFGMISPHHVVVCFRGHLILRVVVILAWRHGRRHGPSAGGLSLLRRRRFWCWRVAPVATRRAGPGTRGPSQQGPLTPAKHKGGGGTDST